MASGRIIKAAIAGLGFCVVMAQTARAGSAANDYVTVSASGVTVEADGDNFNIFAPGKDDGFTADVSVSAVGKWTLVKPEASELPLKMSGNGMKSAGYEVEDDDEGEGGGGIAFYNYYITSNQDDGAKDIVVPTGASVIYTAYKNGKECPSNWTVTGQKFTETKNNESKILFNRKWWDVPEWYVPAFDTPKAGFYMIEAKDFDHAILEDFGSMDVFGGRFTIYAIPPAGGGEAPFTNTADGLDVGHTSWKLEVIPKTAEEYVIKYLDKELEAKYLGVCVGYYPTSKIKKISLTPPGKLEFPDSTSSTSKSYDISIDQLVKGLKKTSSIEKTPGTYILGTYIYSKRGFIVEIDKTFSSDWNCTSVCLSVGNAMGLTMPSAYTDWKHNKSLNQKAYKGNSPWQLYKALTTGN